MRGALAVTGGLLLEEECDASSNICQLDGNMSLSSLNKEKENYSEDKKEQEE